MTEITIQVKRGNAWEHVNRVWGEDEESTRNLAVAQTPQDVQQDLRDGLARKHSWWQGPPWATAHSDLDGGSWWLLTTRYPKEIS